MVVPVLAMTLSCWRRRYVGVYLARSFVHSPAGSTNMKRRNLVPTVGFLMLGKLPLNKLGVNYVPM